MTAAHPAPADAAFAAAYDDFSRAYYAGTTTAEAWRRWRQERLTAVLRHVSERSPFYRERLRETDIDTITPATLHRLPFTTKDDLRHAMYDVLSGPVAEAAVYYETTGTTGRSTPCPRSARDILTSNRAVQEAWRRLFAVHFPHRPPVVGLMGPSELYAFGDVFSAVTASLGACHVKIWPESPRVGFEKALRLIAELGVEVIVCAPALCLSLAKAALHHGYDLSRLPVRLFLTLGEICTDEFAANVSSLWPHAVVRPALYGSQEALCVATGADTGALHLAAPNYLVELIDPDTGDVLGDMGTGELVLTMLVDGIKPLIRYRTGDLVEITPPPPNAPLPGPVIRVIGRAADRIVLGDSALHPAELEAAVLKDVRGCLGYQVVVDRRADGSDTVTVRVDLLTAVSDDAAAVGAAIAARLRARTGCHTDVVVDTDLDPVTTTGSFVSWKAARVWDRRTEPDPAALIARQVAPRYAITT